MSPRWVIANIGVFAACFLMSFLSLLDGQTLLAVLFLALANLLFLFGLLTIKQK